MDRYRRSTLLVFLVIGLLVAYMAMGVDYMETEIVTEYPLVQIAGGPQPIYVTHRTLGYYCTYLGPDGSETAEFIANGRVHEEELLTTDGSEPRIEYVYIAGTYKLRYPGGSVTAKAQPYFDSVKFYVPEGSIAEY